MALGSAKICFRNDNSDTYKEVNSTGTEIINEHKTIIKESHNFKFGNENIPSIYRLPKQHKQPIGSRFIVAGKSCTVTTLSQNLYKALKPIHKSIQ